MWIMNNSEKITQVKMQFTIEFQEAAAAAATTAAGKREK